jgi:hypothetical protein
MSADRAELSARPGGHVLLGAAAAKGISVAATTAARGSRGVPGG